MPTNVLRGLPFKGRPGVAHLSTGTGVAPKFTASPAANQGRIYMGGLAVVGTLFGGFYYHLHRKQARKLANDGESQAVPTWEYRIHQSNSSPATLGGTTGTGTLRASSVGNRSEPLEARRQEHNAQHTTRKSLREQGSDAYPRDESGAPTQPVPQRDRGDGVAYTKKASRDYA